MRPGGVKVEALLKTARADAIEDERAAADRLRQAEDDLAKAVRADKAAQDGDASPKKQRKALTRKRDAADIVQRFWAVAEGKKAPLAEAEEALAAHQAEVDRLKTAWKAAERDAENPPPRSRPAS